MASVTNTSSEQSATPTLDDTTNKKIAVQALVKEVEELKENVKLKVMANRNEIMALKGELQQIQNELVKEIKLMKEVALTLFEMNHGEPFIEPEDDAGEGSGDGSERVID